MKHIDKNRIRLIKKIPEYKSLKNCYKLSILIIIFLSYLVYKATIDGASSTYFVIIIFFIALYLCGGILAFWLQHKIKTNEYNGIKKGTRKMGIALIVFGFLGNPFSLLSGLLLVKEDKTIEYKLSYYSALVASLTFIISYLNLFKDNVYQYQLTGVYILGAIFVLQWIGVLTIGLLSSSNSVDKKLKPIAYFYITLALSANIFSLITGLVILTKIKNEGRKRHISWLEILKRLFRNSTAVMGMFFIVFLIAISIYSFIIFDYSLAIENDYNNTLAQPSIAFPFGADEYGRDVFVRIIFGARISLAVGIVSTAIPILIGGLLGALAGYYGKRTDNIIMRILDILYAIPGILLAVAIVAAFGASTFNLIMALSIGGIPGYARMVRAQVMQLADSEFIEASRAIGAPSWRIIFEDIIPNSLSPVIVRATLSIGGAVLSTSALSYLGLGVKPPTPEWGNILKAGSEYLEFYPHLAIFPGLAIVAVVLAFNFFGDGLRDALDPKLK